MSSLNENIYKYKLNSSGDEIYKRESYGDERYITINRLHIMAKKKNSNGILVPYFARDIDDHPIFPVLEQNMIYLELDIPYPKNSVNKQLYPKSRTKEYYIGVNKICKYAKENNEVEYFARNKNEPYYAFKPNEKGELVEFPAQNSNKEAIYIINNDRIVYPRNLTKKSVIYPLDAKGNAKYIEINNKQIYAIDFNFPEYLKDKSGNPIFALDNNIPYYGYRMENDIKCEKYPMSKKRKMLYLEQNQLKIYAKNGEDQIYAQNENGTEYLADKNNIPYYAQKNGNFEFYPCTVFKKNFYKKINNVEQIAINTTTNKGFYADDGRGNQFYPQTFENEGLKPILKTIETNIGATIADIISHDASNR